MISTIIICVLAGIVVLLLCACLSVANFAGESFYEKYKQVAAKRPQAQMNVMEFFRLINQNYFDSSMRLAKAKPGEDAYAGGVLFLSQETVQKSSLASFAIVAHELGHAKQDKDTNQLKRMSALRKAGGVIGFFMFPLLIAGLIMLFFGGVYLQIGIALAALGILIFITAIVIKALTIKIEKEASKNALIFLKEVLMESEVEICKSLLDDAVLTYWADMFRALLGWTMLTRKGKLFR